MKTHGYLVALEGTFGPLTPDELALIIEAGLSIMGREDTVNVELMGEIDCYEETNETTTGCSSLEREEAKS